MCLIHSYCILFLHHYFLEHLSIYQTSSSTVNVLSFWINTLFKCYIRMRIMLPIASEILSLSKCNKFTSTLTGLIAVRMSFVIFSDKWKNVHQQNCRPAIWSKKSNIYIYIFVTLSFHVILYIVQHKTWFTEKNSISTTILHLRKMEPTDKS